MTKQKKNYAIYFIFVAVLSSNITSDYQEESLPEDTNPLSNTWLKAEDTRKYAEKLTKYSSKNRIKENLLEPVMRANNQYYKLTTPPQRQISVVPNRGMPTVMVQSGSSDIIMREFRPVEQLTSNPVDREYDYINFDKSEKAKSEASEQTTGADTDDVEIQMDSTSKYAPMRSWGRTNSPRIVMDYPTEDTDEDNIVYKPV
ncbi:hypothetical protein O3G_MSEX003423 [Manduca sexta]|uniref:Uncharacterized protein n=1 Tax=Manduca sexta TaxID=7130 RepID=A0A921YS61_MANSE|nr:hypothetical protein O3G_MSEX003423 [Manduca sexta]